MRTTLYSLYTLTILTTSAMAAVTPALPTQSPGTLSAREKENQPVTFFQPGVCIRKMGPDLNQKAKFVVGAWETRCKGRACTQNYHYYFANTLPGKGSAPAITIKEIPSLEGLEISKALDCLQGRPGRLVKATVNINGFGEISPVSQASPNGMTFLVAFDESEESPDWEIRPTLMQERAVKTVAANIDAARAKTVRN